MRCISIKNHHGGAASRGQDCGEGMRKTYAKASAANSKRMSCISPRSLVYVAVPHVSNQPDTPPETLIETLSILTILISRFPAYLSSPNLQPQPLTILTPLLSHPRTAVRKRAITTLAQFLPTAHVELFATLLNTNILPGLAASANVEQQRTTVQLIAAVARHTSHHMSPVLNDVVPGVIKAAQRDDEELRESCLQVRYRLSIGFLCSNRVFRHWNPWF